MMTFKSGFISVVGRPNVGKSTLINKLVGEKVNIITAKPQTTRNKIRAIYNDQRGQIIFVDTPGIHKPKNELDEFMLTEAYKSLKETDLVIFILDATSPFGRGDNFIYEKAKKCGQPLLPVLNKIDKLQGKERENRLKNYQDRIEESILIISAKTGTNLKQLLIEIFSYLPEGPPYYPRDMYTDQIEQFMIQEIIREKIFQLTRQEIPYGVAVLVEEIKEREQGKLFIRANIYVEKKSHKGIIIGKKGRMLKEIGRRARKDVEKLMGEKIYLDLWIKIEKNWRDNEELMKRLGYRG